MKITKYSDALIMITQYRLINCFLVIEDDGITLVDALTKGAGRNILKVVSETGRPLKRILLTHAHSDHVGSIDEIVSLSPTVEFLVPERAIPILVGDVALQAGEPKGRLLRVAYHNVKARPTDVIRDGDQVGSLQVIATPGHTVEHHAYFDKREGTLVAGDCWQTLGGLAVVGDTRWRFPIPSWGSWHRRTNITSARKTLEYEPKNLAVGHGGILGNAGDAMSMALERAATKIP